MRRHANVNEPFVLVSARAGRHRLVQRLPLAIESTRSTASPGWALTDLPQLVPVVNVLPVDREDAVARLHAGDLRGPGLDDDLHRSLVGDLFAADEQAEEDEHGREEVVGERAGRDGHDACPERRVRVAARVFRVVLLVRVHARDLHVGEERNERDLVDRVAVGRLVPPDTGPESDAESDDPHAELARGEVVTAFVSDHQDGEPEDGNEVRRDRHRQEL